MVTRSKGSQPPPPQAEALPQLPNTSPTVQGGGDFSPYVWKQLGDIQQTLGRLEASLGQVQRNADKAEGNLDSRLASLEAKVSGIQTKLYTAGVILAILLVVGGWIFKEVWDLSKPLIVEKLRPTVAAPATSVQPK